MRPLVAAFLLLVLLPTLAGCGGGREEGPDASVTAPPPPARGPATVACDPVASDPWVAEEVSATGIGCERAGADLAVWLEAGADEQGPDGYGCATSPGEGALRYACRADTGGEVGFILREADGM